MLFLYRFFCGILEVEFFGVYPEKVLNLCAKNRISIWSARFVKQKICCKITARDFLRLRKILRKSGIRVHIKRKIGYPFFIRKYNKRFGIFAGLIIFISFLQLMSGHIWIIEVTGNKAVSTERILSSCRQLGITEGVRRASISSKSDAQELLLKTDGLAWGSLNIEGCKLTVNVTEITEKTQGTNEATNLVASNDGVITHIDVKSGNCVVKVGDFVSKGDVLVSGIIENPKSTRFVRSEGEITAETQTEISLTEKLVKAQKIPNGKVKNKRVLEIFNLKIPLFVGSENGYFETVDSFWQLKLFSQNLPFKIYTRKFIFQKEHTVTISYEKAVERLRKKAQEYSGKLKDENIIKNENSVILKAVLVERKDIATSEKIIIDQKEKGS